MVAVVRARAGAKAKAPASRAAGVHNVDHPGTRPTLVRKEKEKESPKERHILSMENLARRGTNVADVGLDVQGVEAVVLAILGATAKQTQKDQMVNL